MLLPYWLAGHGWDGPLWAYSMGGLRPWRGGQALYLVAPAACWLGVN